MRSGDHERELRHFRDSIESIKAQTDRDWILILVDDFSDNQAVYDTIDEIKGDLGDRVHVLYSEKNQGPGAARNRAIRYAGELGAPFVLFLDSDDLADPRRLELVRAAFEDETVNVVYTSFDVIDENDNIVPDENILMAVREIIEGYKLDPVEGENAWISIATKKKYTNLTSCTAVRTSLAVREPFPVAFVSEDGHTWFRYGAYPGKFVFLRDIIGHYRICSHVETRSRSANVDFNEKMLEVDTAGFEEAVKLAKKYGTMGGRDENDIRTASHVRLAMSLLHAEAEDCCKKSLEKALVISKEKTLEYIDQLPCMPEYKIRMRAMVP